MFAHAAVAAVSDRRRRSEIDATIVFPYSFQVLSAGKQPKSARKTCL